MKFDPRNFVALWLQKKKIVVDERGGLTSPDKRDFDELFETMFLDYLEQVRAYNKVMDKEGKISLATDKQMKMALNEFVSLEMSRRRDEMIAKLSCTGENLSELEKFVSAATGAKEVRIVAVLAHFLWMVKRKLLDKEVVFHIMPILYGKQGSGKTQALKKLIAPLGSLTLEVRLTEVADSRFEFAMSHNFIAFLDEMAGCQKTDVDVLKNKITATHIDSRKLHGNKVYKIKQNCSLIGATNRPLSEIVYDPTGARRFYEITTLDKMDWKVINEIDFLALYRGIDEKRERGYIEEHLEAIAKDQELLVVQDELTAFIEYFNITTGTKEVTCGNMYDIYHSWAESNGIKPLNSIWFGRKLANKNIPLHRRRVGSKQTTFYLIDEASSIHQKSLIGDPLSAKKVWA